MAGSLTDKITETFNGQNPTSTTVASPRVISGSTLVCQSLAGWPITTAVHFATYQKNSTGAKIAGSQTDWKGVVSGSSINSLTRQGAAADGGNGVGDIVEMMPTYSWANDLAKGFEVLHNNDGTWKQAAALDHPTITDYTNANHTHASPAQGGVLNISALSNAHKFFVYRNSAQNTASIGFQKIQFDTKSSNGAYDTSGDFDAAVNNRFIAPLPGYYKFNAATFLGTTIDGALYFLTLYKNGSEYLRLPGGGTAGGTGGMALGGVSPAIPLALNDYIEVFIYNSNSAEAMQVGVGPTTTWFSGEVVEAT